MLKDFIWLGWVLIASRKKEMSSKGDIFQNNMNLVAYS